MDQKGQTLTHSVLSLPFEQKHVHRVHCQALCTMVQKCQSALSGGACRGSSASPSDSVKPICPKTVLTLRDEAPANADVRFHTFDLPFQSGNLIVESVAADATTTAQDS